MLPTSKEHCFNAAANQAQLGEIGVALGASLNNELAMFVQQTAVQLEARLDDQVALLGSSLNATLLKLVETTAVHFQAKLDAAMKYTDERFCHRMCGGAEENHDRALESAESNDPESAEFLDSPSSQPKRAFDMPRELMSEVDRCITELDRRRLVDRQALEAEDARVWQAMHALQLQLEHQLSQALVELQQLMDQAEDGRRLLIESAASAADARTSAFANQSERLEQLTVKMRDGFSEEAKGRATLALALEQDLREEKEARKARCSELADKLAAHSEDLQVLADDRAKEMQKRDSAVQDIERRLKTIEEALTQERAQREQNGQALLEQMAACRREVTDEKMERTHEAIDLRRDFQAIEKRQAQAIKDLRKDAEAEGAKRAMVSEQLERHAQSFADTLSAGLLASSQALGVLREDANRRFQEVSEALEHERVDREEGQAGMRSAFATRQDVGGERDARGQDICAVRRELQDLREELAAKAGELHCRFEADGASRAHLTESAERDLRGMLDQHVSKLRTLSEGHEREVSARSAAAEDLSHQLAELSRNLQDERTRREHGDASVRAELVTMRSDWLEGNTQRSNTDAELRNAVRAVEAQASQLSQDLRADLDAVVNRCADEVAQHQQQRIQACEDDLCAATARCRALETSQAALRESFDRFRNESETVRSDELALAAENLDELRKNILEQFGSDLERERLYRSGEASELRRSIEAMKNVAASQQQVEDLRRDLFADMRKESAAEQVTKLDASIAEMGQEMVLYIEEQLRERDATTAQLRRQQAVTDGVAKAVRKDLGLLRTAVISRFHVDGWDSASTGLEMPFGLVDCLATSIHKLQRGPLSQGQSSGERAPTNGSSSSVTPMALPGGMASVPESSAAGPLSVACLEAKLAALDQSIPHFDRERDSDASQCAAAIQDGSTALLHERSVQGRDSVEPPPQTGGSQTLADLVSSVQKAFAASLAGTPHQGPS